MARALWAVHKATIASNVHQLGQLFKIYLEAFHKKHGKHYLNSPAGNAAATTAKIDRQSCGTT